MMFKAALAAIAFLLSGCTYHVTLTCGNGMVIHGNGAMATITCGAPMPNSWNGDLSGLPPVL